MLKDDKCIDFQMADRIPFQGLDVERKVLLILLLQFLSQSDPILQDGLQSHGQVHITNKELYLQHD